MTKNLAKTFDEYVDQVLDYARSLREPGVDVRLALYMIRDAAWHAMTDIDHRTMAEYHAQHPTLPLPKRNLDRIVTADDLDV